MKSKMNFIAFNSFIKPRGVDGSPDLMKTVQSRRNGGYGVGDAIAIPAFARYRRKIQRVIGKRVATRKPLQYRS